MTDNVRIT